MAFRIFIHILIPALFFLSFQFKSAGIAFIPIYSFMLYFLAPKRKPFRSAFLIFFVFWLLMLYWLLFINVDLNVLQRVLIGFGWVFLSALMGLVWSFPYSFISLKKNEIYLLPVALSATEFLLSFSRDLSFLWVTPSTAVIDYPVMVQSADLGGSYLVSLLVIMFSVVLFKMFSKKRAPLEKMLFALLAFAVVIYGAKRMSEDYTGDKINVTVVQPNIPGEMKESYREFVEYRFASIKENLKAAAEQSGDVVIFPETASPVYLTKRANNEIRDYLLNFADSTGKAIIIGGLTYEYGKKNEDDRYYNSAFYISKGETIESYHKIRCVPFVERMPYEEKLRILKKIDYGQGGYSVGESQIPFDRDGIAISAYICFESIFPSYVAGFSRSKSKLLVNISEDAWFIKSIGARQHYQAGILRAVENRKYLIRCSNPGISAVVDPCGRVLYSTKLNSAEVFTYEVALLEKEAFFASSKNLLPKIFLFITLLTLIAKIIRRKNDKSKTENSA